VRREGVGGAKFWTPPVLAVEIRSPSTAIVYRNAKLTAGAYQQVAQATGSDALRIERPFPVELLPAKLTIPPRP